MRLSVPPLSDKEDVYRLFQIAKDEPFPWRDAAEAIISAIQTVQLANYAPATSTGRKIVADIGGPLKKLRRALNEAQKTAPDLIPTLAVRASTFKAGGEDIEGTLDPSRKHLFRWANRSDNLDLLAQLLGELGEIVAQGYAGPLFERDTSSMSKQLYDALSEVHARFAPERKRHRAKFVAAVAHACGLPRADQTFRNIAPKSSRSASEDDKAGN